MRRLALPALVVLVLGASGAAFAVTQVLKTSKAPAKPARWNEVSRPGEVPRALAPTCGCPDATIVLPIDFRKRDRVTVRVLALDGSAVATVAEQRRVPRGLSSFEWDGRDAAGSAVPDGAYRIEVDLELAGRTILFPARLRVDNTPPRPARVLAPRRPLQLTAGADSGRVWVRLRTRERSRPILLLDGEVVRRGSLKEGGRTTAIDWSGERGDTRLEPGTYTLELVLEDPLGNRSDPVAIQPITIVAERA